MFDTGVDGVRLCLHIGLGCGEAIQGIVVDTLKNGDKESESVRYVCLEQM